MLRLISYFHTVSLYPAARLIVTAQSELQRIKTMGQKPVVHFEQAYDGRRIMLLALYEKGVLRPDVMRLLQAARAEGLYILAVNTLKLRDPMALEGLVDCYIERPNFGRDFGSYKTGFLHVFRKGWHKTCPRLLMINDSVYFSQERLPKFLNDMMTSDIEVLGSTENYEIEYHLGSFCIAMGQSVLQRPLFQAYWKGYRLTDVRPRVIKRGEMKLSKTLKRCVSSLSQFKALYGSTRFYNDTLHAPDLLSFSLENARVCSETPARRLDTKAVLSHLEGSLLHDLYPAGKQTVQIESSLQESNSTAFVSGVQDIRKIVEHNLVEFSTIDDEKFTQTVRAAATELFMRHSQIHQNPAVLIRMGLPIVKLDLIYRGMANVMDMTNIIKQLGQDEAIELSDILMSRPYGEHVLFGWKRAAFMVGLI